MKSKFLTIGALVAVMGLTAIAPAFAENSGTSSQGMASSSRMMHGNFKMDKKPQPMKPAVSGKVTAVNGNTITVSGLNHFGKDATTTIFTVDISKAKILKDNATGTAATILVGDNVFVQGIVNGTNVSASIVHDGIMKGMENKDGKNSNENMMAQFQGNGEPVIAGTVSSVSSSSITITNTGNVTYTVDVTNAKIVKGNATTTVSGIVAGDHVIVQGTVNGTSVAATTVIDQVRPQNPEKPNAKPQGKGFIGAIGGFFAHLFGF